MLLRGTRFPGCVLRLCPLWVDVGGGLATFLEISHSRCEIEQASVCGVTCTPACERGYCGEDEACLVLELLLNVGSLFPPSPGFPCCEGNPPFSLRS